MADGIGVVVVASEGRVPTHPMWFLNLRANPDVHVQIRAQTTPCALALPTRRERAQLWPRFIAHNPRWAKHQPWTDRVIPLVVCEPV
jgi:deazaflavin-dependent oxidoreductase (nitroreductase family)